MGGWSRYVQRYRRGLMSSTAHELGGNRGQAPHYWAAGGVRQRGWEGPKGGPAYGAGVGRRGVRLGDWRSRLGEGSLRRSKEVPAPGRQSGRRLDPTRTLRHATAVRPKGGGRPPLWPEGVGPSTGLWLSYGNSRVGSPQRRCTIGLEVRRTEGSQMLGGASDGVAENQRAGSTIDVSPRSAVGGGGLSP